MLQGPGENAGVLDLGEGSPSRSRWRATQPSSAVEPFQGAATGVGGILRDISAMGRAPSPCSTACFGAADDHFSRAVGGVGHYGNCVGVPNVGGEVVFDERCVQLPRQRDVRRAAARGAARARESGDSPGTDRAVRRDDGAATGSAARRCSRAPSSARTTPTSARRSRSATRSREAADRGLRRARRARARPLAPGLRRGGARVVTLPEMAADFGIDVHLDRVPQREEGMEPWR